MTAATSASDGLSTTTATLPAAYRTADLHGSAPSVRGTGWHTPERTVPAA
ncbi:hypothetical protein [Streptomyces camelliae]|uniref:Uncharacterized protein n=1 Tax=Streptomyces camelliae TaxID=3004093 RepID=A0ABY7PFX6_9ACTN|nr:hypothetical protein [Streptomyces sp. HUAS 2-6]WBO69526.1 hypothetical protein O1G22_37695 [Streptomyces sp. HUAS 2-6]